MNIIRGEEKNHRHFSCKWANCDICGYVGMWFVFPKGFKMSNVSRGPFQTLQSAYENLHSNDLAATNFDNDYQQIN